MSDNEQPPAITIYVDGDPAEVPAGMNLVDAVAIAGKEIPHYCYHPKLSVSGNCRMCLIELGMPGKDRATGEPMLDDDGNPVIQWVPKPVIACATNAAPGMHVKTESKVVKECREGVMEFLLINHPLDCPICDQAGECRLQEFATDYGRGYSRFVEEKNVKPKRTRIGPRVILDDERCILCSRCIRFCDEVIGEHILGFTERGSYSTLTTFPGRQLDSNYSLNTVDICPVGALTSTDFRFRMRVWFLKETNSIDTESSVGCNTVVGSREGKIYRITPRRNDEVNDTWMPDSGRSLYQMVDSEDRLTAYTIGGKPGNPEAAFQQAAGILKMGSSAIVGSGRLSFEEQFLLRQTANELGEVPTWIVARTGEGDGQLLSRDRNPNVRGALVSGLIPDLPEEKLEELGAKIDAGGIKRLLVVAEDLVAAGLTPEQLKKVEIVYIGTHHNETSQAASVEIPMLTVFEKSGTFINQQFRVQKFSQAVPGPSGVLFGLNAFTRLLAAVSGEEAPAPSPSNVWDEMARNIPQLEGWRYADIPETGQVLDATAWDQLNFIEGPSLHFEPKTELAGAAS